MPQDHIVKSFDQDLARIENLIAQMGGIAEAQLARSIDAVMRQDQEAAEEAIASDTRIDQLDDELYEFAVTTVALRQPMAQDLRRLISALKISSAIERIGDYAKNIAKRSSTLTGLTPNTEALNTIERMGQLAQEMIKNALDAYIEDDLNKALDVRNRDEEIDLLNTSLFQELLTHMAKDSSNVASSAHLLFIAKNIERVGDHITDITEQIHFMIEGVMPEEDRPKGDHSSFTVIDPDAQARHSGGMQAADEPKSG